MAVISISRGSSRRALEVAELVARQLQCRCLSREDVLRNADLTDVDEAEIRSALDQPHSFMERRLGNKDYHVARVRAALLTEISDDQVVYHGAAGHYFLKDIPHALKVRVLAALSDRVATLVEREGISAQEAVRLLEERDLARRQWALQMYGVDSEDPTLYDLVLNVGKLEPDAAASIICELVQDAPFASTEQTRQELVNYGLVASVEAVLVDMEIDLDTVDIEARDGNVTIRAHSPPRTQAGSSRDFASQYVESLRHRLHLRTRQIPGLKAAHLELAKD